MAFHLAADRAILQLAKEEADGHGICQQGPRDCLCQTASASPLKGGSDPHKVGLEQWVSHSSGAQEAIKVAQHACRRTPDKTLCGIQSTHNRRIKVGHGQPLARDAVKLDLVAPVVRRVHQV